MMMRGMILRSMMILALAGVLTGCDRRDDIAVIEIVPKEGLKNFKALPMDTFSVPSLPSEAFTANLKDFDCLHRKSRTWREALIGVCRSRDMSRLLVYRGFSPKFHLREKGFTPEVIASPEFLEMKRVAEDVKAVLRKNRISYSTHKPDLRDVYEGYLGD